MLGSFDRLGFRRHARDFVASELDVDLRDRRVVVTGASAGIGLAAAEALVHRGARVVLICRDQQRGEEALVRLRAACPGAQLELRRVDVASLEEVRRFCEEDPGPVDGLVHNAGVLPRERSLTPDGLEVAFATHVAGPHLMTLLLADRMRPGARVVFVTSGGMYLHRVSLDDLDWRARPFDADAAHAQTKRMQVLLAQGWADRLAGASAYVYAMHPGWVDTASARSAQPRLHRVARPILRTAAEGADTIVWLCARRVPAAPSGALFFDRRAVRAHYLPWTHERPTDRAALFALLDQLIDR